MGGYAVVGYIYIKKYFRTMVPPAGAFVLEPDALDLEVPAPEVLGV